jgi:hypothetical protein
MKYQKASIRLKWVNISIVIFCICYHLFVFFTAKPPVFEELVSARIIGADETFIFVQLNWKLSKNNILPYRATFLEGHFWEDSQMMSNVFIDDSFVVSPLSQVSMNAGIKKETFRRLLSNHIDAYSFHLVADVSKGIFGIRKKQKIDQRLPINLQKLMFDFMVESSKNFFTMTGFETEQGNLNNLIVRVSLLNQSGLELNFREFEGRLTTHKNSSGPATYFSPVMFRSNESSRSSSICFTLNSAVDSGEQLRFIINGTARVGLWGRIYSVPVELLSGT